MNYLPVLILDLINRGVNTIENPGLFFKSFPKMKKDQQLRKSVLFNCIPYTSKEYLS
jgi:hypothetical protein